MKITITDVAKLSGVAKSTVSRHLNGGYVSEETRKKIDKVIKETKYEPNTFAQSLKAKKTNLIGVIVPRLNSYAANLLLKGIDEKLRHLGYQMLISNADQLSEREIESLYSFANQKVAGIILIATELSEKHFEAIKNINLPVLSVGQYNEKIPSLIYDDEDAGYSLGKYITDCGHQKIIYLGVTEKDIAVGIRRKQGFMKAIHEQDKCQITYYESDFLIKSAYDLFLNLAVTGTLDEVTIVACATDNIALGVMKAIGKKDLKVPDDISVTGFGDYEMADLVGLTTVNYPYQEAGQIAAQTIVSLGEGLTVNTEKKLPCKLVVRESVKEI